MINLELSEQQTPRVGKSCPPRGTHGSAPQGLCKGQAQGSGGLELRVTEQRGMYVVGKSQLLMCVIQDSYILVIQKHLPKRAGRLWGADKEGAGEAPGSQGGTKSASGKATS